jgi:putative hydrolase of HD superfamily
MKQSKADKKTETDIDQLMKLKLINKLKSIYRLNSVDKRHESTAEHSWSALVLADYYLNKIAETSPKLKLDRLKVYELLMYHDLVEIYAGDSPLSPGIVHKDKSEREELAALKLKKELPQSLSAKFYSLFHEFEDAKTIEAKFAILIDIMDAQIHGIDNKKDWKGWTKEFMIDKKLQKFEQFPELKKDFLDLLDFMEQEGYFNQ